jgi:hypothetical protein
LMRAYQFLEPCVEYNIITSREVDDGDGSDGRMVGWWLWRRGWKV